MPPPLHQTADSWRTTGDAAPDVAPDGTSGTVPDGLCIHVAGGFLGGVRVGGAACGATVVGIAAGDVVFRRHGEVEIVCGVPEEEEPSSGTEEAEPSNAGLVGTCPGAGLTLGLRLGPALPLRHGVGMSSLGIETTCPCLAELHILLPWAASPCCLGPISTCLDLHGVLGLDRWRATRPSASWRPSNRFGHGPGAAGDKLRGSCSFGRIGSMQTGCMPCNSTAPCGSPTGAEQLKPGSA